jgi:hypothetical protein
MHVIGENRLGEHVDLRTNRSIENRLRDDLSISRPNAGGTSPGVPSDVRE